MLPQLTFAICIACTCFVWCVHTQVFNCTGSCPDYTCSDEDCEINCIGNRACLDVNVYANYSDTSTLRINCLDGDEACDSIDIFSSRETIINCGRPHESNDYEECRGLDAFLTNLPPNSTSQLNCLSEFGCRQTDLFCRTGDSSSSCELNIIGSVGWTYTTRLFCEGSVALKGYGGHCLVNCSYRSSSSTDGACDVCINK